MLSNSTRFAFNSRPYTEDVLFEHQQEKVALMTYKAEWREKEDVRDKVMTNKQKKGGRWQVGLGDCTPLNI